MSDKISELIQQLGGTKNDDNVQLLVAQVNAADPGNRLCNVTTITGTRITFDAKLQAEIADGLLVVPKKGSTVIILKSKKILPFVVFYSDVESYSLNGDEFGGLVKVQELTQKLNALEQKFNEVFAWSAGVSPPFVSDPFVPTLREEIENKTVTHGE